MGAALMAGPLEAQTEEPTPDWSEARFEARFEPMAWLIGEWQGYGEFSDRTTYIHKRYSYEVAGMYLVEKTLDIFPPPEVSTDFEVHQDFSVFYRENKTGEFSANGFYVETFVTGASVTLLDDGESFVVESSSIHNGPPGMRTRITYTRIGTDEFRLLFEIAPPELDYQVTEQSRFRRIR
jgi:hypothetical protein